MPVCEGKGMLIRSPPELALANFILSGRHHFCCNFREKKENMIIAFPIEDWKSSGLLLLTAKGIN